jgi:hypothetical protein
MFKGCVGLVALSSLWLSGALPSLRKRSRSASPPLHEIARMIGISDERGMFLLPAGSARIRA